MDLGLQGKAALVTGGSHGIGLATAKALKAEGCGTVMICARDKDRLRQVSKEYDLYPLPVDVLDDGAVEALVLGLYRDHGWGIDILVNNVGGGGRWGDPIIEQNPIQVWTEVYAKNMGAAVGFTRYAIPWMRRKKWGRVVTVASIYGKEGGGRPWFTAAKAAEVALMKSLARTPYLVRDGLTFNSVAPGRIAIPGTGSDQDAEDPDFALEVDRDLPLGRLGTAEEVASVIAFLCSKQAKFVNGACIAVDGGESRSF